MKINKTNEVLQVYNNLEINRTRKGGVTSAKDTISFSETAKDYQFAINKLKELPEVRREKVEKLKEEIQAGNYNVAGKEIAEKIYKSIYFDEKA